MLKSSALNNFNLPFHSDKFSPPPVQLTIQSVLHGTSCWLSKGPAAFEVFLECGGGRNVNMLAGEDLWVSS